MAGDRTPLTELPPGIGVQFRHELLLRSFLATGLAVVFLGAAIYGAYYASASVDLGVPFIVIGAGGVLSHTVLTSAMLRSRSAISGDAYGTAAVIRAQRFTFGGMVSLAFVAVVTVLWVLAKYGDTLAGFSAFGLLGVAGISAPAWSALHRLASHTRSAS